MSELELTPEEETLLIEICEHGRSYTRPNKILAGLARKRLVEWTHSHQAGRGCPWYYNYGPTKFGTVVYSLIR